jgi:hypothetical protein
VNGSQPDLLTAFDQAIAAVRRLETQQLHTSAGRSAAPELELLLGELTRWRGEVAAGAPLDPAWAGRTVRWVTEWLPNAALPLLARLGGIARASAGSAGRRP